MATFNFAFGSEDEEEEESVGSECEHMFETLSTNAWDGVVSVIEGQQESNGEEQEVAEAEGEEDVV